MPAKNVVLGELKRVELREVWTDEARDFTPWLAKPENLMLLSKVLGDVELELEGVEVSVGTFKSDIVATDAMSKGRVIIENQLEKTNHDHLGKIITYASGLDARIIVWIAREFTEEHRQAVDFLNEQAAPDLRIYGIEMKLYRIGNSEPAPEFSVVSRPNEYVALLKNEKHGLTETRALYNEFWTGFKSSAEQARSTLSIGKPSTVNWIQLSIGRTNFYIGLTAKMKDSRVGCEIYIGGPTAKQAFKLLKEDKAAIEKETGSLDWQELPEGQDCRIVIFRQGVPITDKTAWPEAFKWLRTQAETFTRTFATRIRNLQLNGDAQ